MKYTDYLSLSPKDQFLYRLDTFFKHFGQNFVQFWINVWHGFLTFFIKIGRSFKILGYIVKNGDIYTKLSFLILGLSHIKRKQYIKGFMMMAVEALFIFYMVMFGVSAFAGLITLGIKELSYGCFSSNNIYGIDLGGLDIKELRFLSQSAAVNWCSTFTGSPNIISFEGDRSPLFLLFGILCVMIIIAFIFYWVSSVNQSMKIQEKKECRLHINTFIEDCKDYFDGKFYRVLLLLPIIGILTFTILPIFDMIFMAFTNYDAVHQEPVLFDWVGFDNFVALFSNSGTGSFGYTFWNVLGWTLVWAFFATFTNYFAGMFVAMLINKKGIILKPLWRTMLVLSISIPSFVTLMAMNKFLSQGGIVEGIMASMGLIEPGSTLQVFSNATSARIAVILINMWIGVPYTVLTATGILLNIPQDLYESAQMDGTSVFRTYTKITLPYMLFVTGPSLVGTFVGNINNFNVIFFLTGGGPRLGDYNNAGKTDLLVTWLYSLTVNNREYSMGSVIGILVFIVCASLSLIVFRNTSGYKNEETFA